jgi:hypothetical protein
VLSAVVGTACDPGPSAPPSGTPAAIQTPGSTSAAGPVESLAPTGAVPEPTQPPAPAPGTGADMIRAAEAEGRLDAPTALLYRVYALFGDRRLPAEFAAGAWDEDDGVLDQAIETIDTLPAAIAAELRPFVVRPTNPESVWFGEPATASADRAADLRVASGDARAGALLAAAFATVVCMRDGWGYADGTARFRVWGRCERDELDMLGVASWVDELWTAEVAYLGRAPIPDQGVGDQGVNNDLASDPGATRIDIYLTPGACRSRGGDCVAPRRTAVVAGSREYRGSGAARRTSAFMVVNTGILSDGLFTRAVLAHELFHVIQRAYNSAGVHSGVLKHWFVEASAVWAQYRFMPRAYTVDDVTMTPGRFADFQDSPFSLNTSILENDYWSFAWPLFMDMESPGSVAKAWQAIEGQSGDAAVDRTIDRILPFARRFRDFAVRAFNREWSPTQDRDLLRLFPIEAVETPRVEPGAVHVDPVVELHADVPGIVSYQRSEQIANLYAVYRPFEVDDDVGKVTFDFSDLVPQGSFHVDAIVKIKDKGWERRQLTNGETTFCRDTAKDRVEEIVIVLSDHDLNPNGRVVGTWTVESLQTGCAAITGVLTVERTASYLQLEPLLPDERHDEHLTATIVVNMRPDPWIGGYTDAYDPADPAGSRSSTYTISRTTGASKQMGDCTSSFSTKSVGTWQFKDHPTGADFENGITGFVDRASGTAGFSIVVHYPYEVTENICNIVIPADKGVHDAFICLDARLVEVDGGPDRVEVHCSSDDPAMGYSKTEFTIDGTLILADE